MQRWLIHLFGKTKENNGLNKGWVINNFKGLMNGIKYLHQLQNLYFALTNRELNIKL